MDNTERGRNIATFPIGNSLQQLKDKMLNWANQFSIHLFLDSNNYSGTKNSYECLLAVGSKTPLDAQLDLNDLKNLHSKHKDWLFGHISYDFKNHLFLRLASQNPSKYGFPLLHFFVPEHVLYIKYDSDCLVVETFDQPNDVHTSVVDQQPSFLPVTPVTFCATTDKYTYINNINQLRTHIRNGDCYEINYCNHHCASDVDIDPVSVFKTLNRFSPAPFAAYYRLNDTYLMCASPERYLKKTGTRIVSQPIKGTARRGETTVADELIKTELRNDVKEQAENVMIVDLVRNDLAITCIPGTIEVEELFGIYSFPHVHQMISTVAGELLPDASFTDPIGHSFPMGSMTGAPKYKVMQLIDQYESVRRELFSGSVGYITPNGDFDLNVVIRSLFYNATSRYLSYNTGGAITYDSIPENEWDEMQLKGWALEKIFRS